MAPTDMAALLIAPQQLCSILFLCGLFLTLLAQNVFCVITYSRKELLDIRVAVTHQHYDQEYDFPELDPFFAHPRAIELIPEAAPRRCWR
jgi:phosphoribosyl 1,2-cyclic phosphodiesterase